MTSAFAAVRDEVYSLFKFKGFDVFGLDLGGLMDALSNRMLDSSSTNYWWTRQRNKADDSLDALPGAICRPWIRKFLANRPSSRCSPTTAASSKARCLRVDKSADRTARRGGYLNLKEVPSEQRREIRDRHGQGEIEADAANIKFEVTEKGLDFLGYKKRFRASRQPREIVHRPSRNHLDTGVEAALSSKQYEFGDTINLDVNATLLSAITREGLSVPINLEYRDLHVHQQDYNSSCATVVMLDCSHSMILYGEDRFTPAKKVASHLPT